ncbi:MAG: DUF429 domain-containing protein, partial [Hyphomicrobiales bacterium]|nr:DUF429 domain-containing protein [Hyphomicrobiales bacterium]
MLARGETDEADGNDAGFVAGLDGCPAGWIVALLPLAGDAPGRIGLWTDFAGFITAQPRLAAIAVDMPIGLPDWIAGPGRAAEQAVRGRLGARQSSVFSIPARAAVEAADYASACRAALATSTPPRKVSKQGFNLFPRIREVDAALRADPGLAARAVETHPEVVFRALAGAPLAHPKKTAAGLAERRALLAAAGL